MEIDIIIVLWTFFSGLEATQQNIFLLFLGSIASIGIAIGRWTSKHTRASVLAENTVLKGELENAKEKSARVEGLLTENRELRIQLEKPPVRSLAYKDGMYYVGNPPRVVLGGQEKNNGPFCPICWEVQRVSVGLQNTDQEWVCRNSPCVFRQVHTDSSVPSAETL